ncbi:MAG: Ku protein [Thermoplasmata archaeon]
MEPRAIWSGAIQFGLVNIPVKLFVATMRKAVSFRSLHPKCGQPLKRPYFCPTDEEQVAFKEVVKGYAYTKDKYVVLTDEDFEKVPLKSSKALEVMGFVEREEVDPLLQDSSYYLGPTELSVKPFELFRQALDLTNKVALAQAAIWKKEQVVSLRPRGEELVMSTLFYEDEVRPPPVIPTAESVELSEAEVNLALELIKAQVIPYDMSQYTDHYREALLEVIKAKVEGREVEAPVVETQETPEDLMAALKASLQAVEKPT